MTTLLVNELGFPHEIEDELSRLSATYELKKVADKGNNGYLIFARNLVLTRDVALKFYFWGDGERAHIEPSALTEVRSPAIIEVLEARIVGEQWALFITPFCRNGDLDKFRESHRFGLHQASQMVETLLNGVAALHAKHFLHRDLKPENILISDANEPLIADFGSVRRICEDLDRVPGSGHSVLYRPPESFSTALYDRRGDLYQCGMILFQLLGGRLDYQPFCYLSAAERLTYTQELDEVKRSQMVDSAIETRATASKLCDLSTLPGFVPRRMRRVVSKALDPDPERRFQHASDMQSALRNARLQSVNWVFEDGSPVAVDGDILYRVSSSGPRRYTVQMRSGEKWRRVPGTPDDTLAKQLQFIEKRCLNRR